MNQSEQALSGIDETIGQVERLYRAVTGADAPGGDAVYAPIPAEKDPAQHVEEQLDRLLETLGTLAPGSVPAPSWTPRVSVWEADSEILVCVDLPGLRREQVEVVAQGNTITVSGARPTARNDLRLRASEIPFGSFRRTLVVPSAVRDAGEPSAQMKDGVLSIRIPRSAASVTPKPVPVQ